MSFAVAYLALLLTRSQTEEDCQQGCDENPLRLLNVAESGRGSLFRFGRTKPIDQAVGTEGKMSSPSAATLT
jgi:hypothetical protein